MPSRRRGESAAAAPPKLKPPAAGPTVDTVTAQVAAEPSTEASVVVTVTAPAEGVVMPAYHRVVLSNGTGFQGYLAGGPVPAPDTTARVDNTMGQTVKVRDLSWSGTSSLSGGVGAPPETDYAPWAASASTRADLAIGYTLAASGALTSVAGSGDARADAVESSIGYAGAGRLDAGAGAEQEVYFRVVGGPVRFTATFSCTTAMQGGFSTSIRANFLIRAINVYTPNDPAFVYCNAWGKPTAAQTVTGVLAPGEYLLPTNGGSTAFALAGGSDLQTGTSTYQFQVRFGQ